VSPSRILAAYLGKALASYWRFVPGVLLSLVLALAAPRGLALYGLVVLLSLPSYATAASKTLGHYPGGEGAGKLLGLLLSLLGVLVVLVLVALLLAIPLSAWIDRFTGVLLASLFLVALVPLAMMRLWPVYAAPFTIGMSDDQDDWTWGLSEAMHVLKVSWRLTGGKQGLADHGYLAIPSLVLLFVLPVPFAVLHSPSGNSGGWWIAYLVVISLLFPLLNLVVIDRAQRLIASSRPEPTPLDEARKRAVDKVGETPRERAELMTFLEHIPDHFLEGEDALVAYVKTQHDEKVAKEIAESAEAQMLYATETDNTEWMEEALTRGVRPDGTDEDGRPYFTQAVEFGSVSIIDRFLRLGVPIDIRNQDGRTGLELAIGYGKVDLAALLLDRGADLEAFPARQPALHLACSRPHLGMVEFLVGSGLDVEQPSSEGMRPLDFAIGDRRLEIVDYLIDLGADVHHVFHYNGRGHTPLTLAVWVRDLEIVTRLIRSGADPSAAPPGGDSPLFGAAGSVSFEIVKLLLERGANADEQSENGDDAACRAEDQERVSDIEKAQVGDLIRRYQTRA